MGLDRGAWRLLVVAFLAGAAVRADQGPALQLAQGVQIRTVRIGPGSFVQGSSPGEPGREEDEGPRPVRITAEIIMSETPITRGAFAAFVAATGHRTEAERGKSGGYGWNGSALVQQPGFHWRNPGFPQTDAHPVVLVTYADAKAFTAWASERTGRQVRLPTEAEYEYAARGGSTGGPADALDEKKALEAGWFKQNSPSGTHPVGEKPANGFGLYDTTGGVYQWCLDVYAPYGEGPVDDPLVTEGPAGGELRRVLRGGSWLRDPARGRPAARHRSTPGTRSAEIGFRVVAGPLLAETPPAAPAAALAARPAAAPGPTSSGGGGCGAGGFAWLLVAGVGAFIARRFFRGAAGRRANVIDPRLVVRPGADGFWVRSRGEPLAGRSARWRASCAQGEREGRVELVDGAEGTFVYTGDRPLSIELALLAQGSDDPVPPPPGPAAAQPAATLGAGRGFRGYPPAY